MSKALLAALLAIGLSVAVFPVAYAMAQQNERDDEVCQDNLGALKRVDPAEPVSYTHLDVYKRQPVKIVADPSGQTGCEGGRIPVSGALHLPALKIDPGIDPHQHDVRNQRENEADDREDIEGCEDDGIVSIDH